MVYSACKIINEQHFGNLTDPIATELRLTSRNLPTAAVSTDGAAPNNYATSPVQLDNSCMFLS